ncbi:MAG: endonuclease/exonuclease/phosphatase family protein [Gemmataceae bacterium]|nr:endonuclease/exonuclease/phosphatase family protein [Gemmataceae bacterium]
MIEAWLCTWNMSNKNGNDDEIKALADAVPANADLVVLGVQEAKRWKSGIMTRFHGHLPAFDPILGAGEKVKIAKIKCMTKLFEFGYQGMGILLRHGAKDVELVSTGSIDTGGGSGKGGVFALVRIGKSHVAFISAHLPTGSRDKAGMQLFRDVAVLDPKPQAMFLMGDLNYRLDLPATGTAKKRVKLFFKKTIETTDSDDWVHELADPASRKQMALDYDRMSESGLAQQGFRFPFPRLQHNTSDFSFPTYKRESDKAKSDNPCYLLDMPGGQNDLRAQGWIRDGYFGGGDKLKKKSANRGGFDIGWLDRIGVLKGPGLPHVIAKYDHPIALAGTYTSDHAPVGMLVELITNRGGVVGGRKLLDVKDQDILKAKSNLKKN